MFGFIVDKFRRRQGVRVQKPGFDIDQFVDMCNRSLVVKISVIVIVWAFCATMLTLSLKRQGDIPKWQVGETATQSIHARGSFDYIDVEETEKRRAEAENLAPEYFRSQSGRTAEIIARIKEFYQRIEQKKAGTLQNTSPIAQLAGNASPELVDAVIGLKTEGKIPYIRDLLEHKLHSGIIGREDKLSRVAGKKIKVINSSGQITLNPKSISEYPDARDIASETAQYLDVANPAVREELTELLTQVIGLEGNLEFYPEKTVEERQKARDTVPEVIASFRENRNLIVAKGEKITPTVLSMLEAHRKQLPEKFNIAHGVNNLFRSFVILAVVIFYLVSVKPAVIRDSRGIVVTGILVIIGLLVNYWAINLFEYLFRHGYLMMQEFIVVGIPVELPMVLIAVFFGFRQSLAVGFLVVSVTVLMLMPEQYNQFPQVLRWLTVGGLCSLFVLKVVSYRTFFLRVFFSSILVNLMINFDRAFLVHSRNAELGKEIVQGIWVLLGSGFACAVLALVLVFIFEIVFNLDTNMALTVVGNFNHRLLEELRRKAPGTMSHSLTVSTLAEDAAKAIGANSLRAKVGALFHDIGKTDHPEYYTENNPDSAALHDKLSPQLSSLVIREHVKNGIVLARQNHLFRYIREAIATHHGDDPVRFFYEKAKTLCRKNGEPASSVREADFRYNGEPPRGKELVILSLADACEAASRSLRDPSEARIEKLVDDIIVNRLLGKQLRNGLLTLEELYIIRNSFIKTLLGIYHGRLAYPEKESDEKSDLRVEESAPDQAKSKKA